MTTRADLDLELAREQRRRRDWERRYVRSRDAVSIDLTIRLAETALQQYDRWTPQGRADVKRRELEPLLNWQPPTID
jgi:hypothetical protein